MIVVFSSRLVESTAGFTGDKFKSLKVTVTGWGGRSKMYKVGPGPMLSKELSRIAYNPYKWPKIRG